MKSLSLNKPHLIIMVGIPGSGKTFFAEHFSNTFKAPFINVNHLRNNVLNQVNSDDNYDNAVKNASDYFLEEILKTNQTVIYEGFTNRRSERMEIVKKAKQAGYEPLLIWVQTEPITAQKRATAKSYNGRITGEEFQSKVKSFSIPHVSEKALVISGKHTYTSQLKIALIRLASKKPATKPERPIAPISAPARPPMNRSILIR